MLRFLFAQASLDSRRETRGGVKARLDKGGCCGISRETWWWLGWQTAVLMEGYGQK